MSSLTIFLDASVILSGMASPMGGSGYLLQAGSKNKLTLYATPLVIGEVYRHLNKLSLIPQQLESLLDNQTIHLIPNPNSTTISRYQAHTTDPNDAHVLAGAVKAKTDYLISLDKKHILTPHVAKHLSPIQVLSPRQFWSTIDSLNTP